MRLIRAIATLTLAISAAALVAETDKSKGLEIMTEVDLRDEGFDDFSAKISII